MQAYAGAAKAGKVDSYVNRLPPTHRGNVRSAASLQCHEALPKSQVSEPVYAPLNLEAFTMASEELTGFSPSSVVMTRLPADGTTKMTPNPDRLTPAAAAELIGVQPRRILRWVRRYPNLGRRIGGRWVIDPEVLAVLAAGTPGTDLS